MKTHTVACHRSHVAINNIERHRKLENLFQPPDKTIIKQLRTAHGILILFGLLYTSVCQAELSAYIPWTDKTRGTTIQSTLKTFQQIGTRNQEVSRAISDMRSRLAIVFVPGIMGSSLITNNGEVIFGDISSPSKIISRLELSADLIDESKESGIKTELLRSIGRFDIYGDAIKEMEQWAKENNVKLISCGYDWRRDIRSGARDLERCIESRLGENSKDIVIVAHSMGGLVSWTWEKKHETGQYSKNRRLLQLTVLGSPLNGSCEIIRMIQSGYIQPARKDKLRVRSDFKPLKSLRDNFVDSISNALSRDFTQDIRPLVLTWPGALELSPPPTNNELISCVGIPTDDKKPTSTPSLSYYDQEFWSTPAGKQMLKITSKQKSYAIPTTLPSVLNKAREFRESFRAEQLKIPTWLYYSRLWSVPLEAGYDDPYISEPDQWSTDWGDGRVTYKSANNYPDSYVFSYKAGLESAHGDLPSDPNFLHDYFRSRLPEALAAVWAADMMKLAASKPQWINSFSKISQQGADLTQIQSAIEPVPYSEQQSIILREALFATREFNALICAERGDCVSRYSTAKAKSAKNPSSALTYFSETAILADSSSPTYPFAEGNRGLALAKQLDWASATISLQKAEIGLLSKNMQTLPRPSEVIEFTVVIQRNLGKSLLESGRCKAAEPYLRAASNSWPYATEALSKPCNDVESGLQYCFNTSDYCRSE